MRATQRAGMMKYLLNTLIGADGFRFDNERSRSGHKDIAPVLKTRTCEYAHAHYGTLMATGSGNETGYTVYPSRSYRRRAY